MYRKYEYLSLVKYAPIKYVITNTNTNWKGIGIINYDVEQY